MADINKLSKEPKKASNDNGSVENHSLKDQIVRRRKVLSEDSGLKCICGGQHFETIKTQHRPGLVRRTKKCLDCKKRLLTDEKIIQFCTI